MPAGWVAGGVAAAGLVGSYMSSEAAKSAANTSADAQRYAADQAAQAARFTPVGIKTNLGSSNFTMNPDGTIASAGYTLDPRLQGIQNNIYGQAGAYDTQQLGQAAQPLYGGASSLFNLGQQYLATSPQQAAQDYMSQQQGLLAPGREQQLAGLRNQQYQTGRTGLATGGTTAGGLQQTNPELAAYYNSIAQQNSTLAAQSDAYGQQRAQFGAGLFGTAGSLLGQVPALTTAGYSPLQTQLGLVGSIEGMGQQPFDLSTALGAKQSTAGAQVGNALLTGGINAARTAQAGNQYSFGGAALQGLGSNQALQGWFQNQLGGNNSSFGNSGMSSGMSGSYTGNVYDNYGNLASSGNAAPSGASPSAWYSGTGGMGD
jgi:hypothetical protein